MTDSRHRLLAFAGLLYFAEGLPYGIFTELMPVYLRSAHVSLQTIGLLSAVGSLWSWKVLWAPLVELGNYRNWVIAMLAVLTATLGLCGRTPVTLLAVPLIVLAAASATQDMAIDAWTIRLTPAALLGPVNSVRVLVYRAALIAAGGGLTIVGGRYGWPAAFLLAACLLGLILVAVLVSPDDRGKTVVAGGGSLVTAFRRWSRRPRAALLISVVLLYRLGEFAVLPMIKPFWIDCGYSAQTVGLITSVVGITVSVAAAIAGGVIIRRIGLYKGLLWFGVLQILSNLGYALVAALHGGTASIYAASAAENVGYGLGIAAFLTFLMRIAGSEQPAIDYALLTALFGVSRSAIGALSGHLTETIGYAAYFWLSVFLGVPGLLLVPWLRHDITETA